MLLLNTIMLILTAGFFLKLAKLNPCMLNLFVSLPKSSEKKFLVGFV